MKPYPKYRDSGVEWIGQIPSDWMSKRLKFAAVVVSGQSPSDTTYNDEGIGSILVNGPEEYSDSDFGETIAKKWTTDPKKYVPKGALLFCMRGSTTGRLNIAHDYISIGRGCAGIVSNQSQRFLIYGMIALRRHILGLSKGSTFPSVTSEELANYCFPIASNGEQQSVAAFLDAKTRQIDELIEKKRRQIELLKEYRASAISEAVTKGLNPNVRMKDSGVEWIGEIPEHWTACKVKHVADAVKTGSTPPSQVEAYFGGEFDWFTPGDFGEQLILRNANRKITVKAVEDDVVRVFPPASVLLVGIGATLGKIGITEAASSANQQINAIVFRDGYMAFFGAYFLTAFSDVIMAMSDAATLPIFNQTATKNFPILRPPIEEQRAIVVRLRETDFKIEQTSNTLHQQIESLQSYRTSLISEAVTGKIDVRDWAKAG